MTDALAALAEALEGLVDGHHPSDSGIPFKVLRDRLAGYRRESGAVASRLEAAWGRVGRHGDPTLIRLFSEAHEAATRCRHFVGGLIDVVDALERGSTLGASAELHRVVNDTFTPAHEVGAQP
jgi:hypothetical protein